MKSLIALVLMVGNAVAFSAPIDGEVVRSELIETAVNDYRHIGMGVDSGPVSGVGLNSRDSERSAIGRDAIQIAAWSTVVRVEDAQWLRLEFGDVDLSAATQNTRESYLRVTSLLDGHEQYLDFDALQVWGNTSAYFNGNAVRVEIMASPESVSKDRVQITGVQASASHVPASICFSTDDRIPSSDPRDARLMPIGCSAWLFSEHGSTFLTAGHCSPSGGDVVQFNVPFSTSGGGYQSPPPQDQYVVDGASVQVTPGSISLGNDWGFFGVFDNTGTGLTPLAAQGDSHTLVSGPIPNDGRPIRITGYGTTSFPISATWNGIQKTHVGPFQGYSGNVVRYTTDTTGGNSGSVILDDNNNRAIGIHTNAGCGSSGGWNNGCNLFNAGLQNALANPTGIAEPREIQALAVGAPDFVSPQGGDVMSLVVSNFHGHSIVGVPTMWVDSGFGYESFPTTQVNTTTFQAELPPAACESLVSFYFQIEDEEGTVTEHPTGGELAALTTIALDDLTIAVEDLFQTASGWTVFGSGVTDGQWVRLSPLGTTTSGGPTSDADGSGVCYITGRGIFEDLDGGTATLLSPLYDTTVVADPIVSFWAWVTTEDDERMSVEFSPNLGISWFPVDEIQDTNGWELMRYRVADFTESSQIFQVRIVIADEGGDSVVEGGVDGFRISSQLCEDECLVDFVPDGTLNFSDISAFLTAFGNEEPAADLVADGMFNFLDVSELLSLFAAGCP